MKQNVVRSYLFSYLIFIIGSSVAAFFTIPVMCRFFVTHFIKNPAYLEFLQQHPDVLTWISLLCIFLIFLLSFLRQIYLYYKIYGPLSIIVNQTRQMSSSRDSDMISYNKADALGYLASSINYLVNHVRQSESRQHALVSNISHDLRTPLTSIKGYVEAILDGTIPFEMQEKYLNVVLDETKRLQNLTDSLLTLEQLDEGLHNPDRKNFLLVPAIQKTVDSFEGLCGKKDLKIRIQAKDDQIMVYADLSKLEQVLYNLIDNAIKFSNPNSEIIITVRKKNKRIFVSVKDFGEGIEPSHLPHIWDRFYKTDPARGKEKKGSGLGLSIVKEIVQAAGQTIDVISTKNVGTEFIFTIAGRKKELP